MLFKPKKNTKKFCCPDFIPTEYFYSVFLKTLWKIFLLNTHLFKVLWIILYVRLRQVYQFYFKKSFICVHGNRMNSWNFWYDSSFILCMISWYFW